MLSKNYHAIAFDWLGFGFSDKPQAGYGFNYTLDGNMFLTPSLWTDLNPREFYQNIDFSFCGFAEFVSSLESFIDEVTTREVSLVVQVSSITSFVTEEAAFQISSVLTSLLWCFCQGYFSTAVVKYARNRPEKIKNLILLNPPVRKKPHQNLPFSSLRSN